MSEAAPQDQQEREPSPEEILEAEAERIERERDRSERALDHLAEILVDMAKTDAWRHLARLLEDEQTKTHARHLNDLLAGKDLSQRDIDVSRGRIEGLKTPLLVIERAKERLAQREQGQQGSEPDDYEERTYWD